MCYVFITTLSRAGLPVCTNILEPASIAIAQELVTRINNTYHMDSPVYYHAVIINK